jgi:hypothetical protein
MLKNLSGSVLRSVGNGFISLPGAQPFLGISPTTATGFTLVTDSNGNTSYVSSLGYLQFTSGSIYSYVQDQPIQLITTGTGTVIITSTINAVNSGTGALTVAGGVGIGEDLYVGGTIFGNISTSSLTKLTLSANQIITNSTSTTGTLYLMLGNTLSDYSYIATTSSISYNTVNQTVSIGARLTVTNQLNALSIYDSGTRVISRVTAGVGIGGGGVGPTVTLTNTGVLSIIAGTGTHASSTTGNVTIWTDIPTLQSVTNAGNSTTNQVFFLNTSTATSLTTASVIFSGGVAIKQNLIVGQQLTANSVYITSTATYYGINTVTQNALYVAGGIGVGADLTVDNNAIIYGNLTVLGTQTFITSNVIDVGRKVIALSTSAGPAILSIGSGMTVGPVGSPFVSFLFNGVNAWSVMGNIVPSVTRSYNLGSPGYQWNNVYTYNSNVYGQSNVYSLTSSTYPNNGALVVSGGIGVAGPSTYGGTQSIFDATSATSTATGALTVAGGVGIGGDVYAGNIYSNGSVVLTEVSLGQYGVSKLLAGTDTAVSTASGVVTVWNTSNLQTITNRGNSTTNAISITNTTNATNSTTGALIVSGGVGIQKDLFVGGNAIIYGSVTFTGTATNVLTTNTVFTDNILELHKPSTGVEWTVNDGKDIGIRFHYYNTIGTNSFLGRANDTGYLEWYSQGIENPGSTFTGTYGVFKTGEVRLVGTNTAISTTTGALTVQGGAGIGAELYVGGDIYSKGSTVVTAATLGQYGVSHIIAGTDTAISTSTGDVRIWNTSNLQSVTGRGNTTDQSIVITNNTASTGTNSGALIVAGGVGVGGDVYARAIFANNAYISNISFTSLALSGDFLTTSPSLHPVAIENTTATGSTYLVNNSSSSSTAYGGLTIINDINNYVELGLSSSQNAYANYDVGSGFLYISPLIPSFNIGDSSQINFFTQGTGDAQIPTLSLGATGTSTFISRVVVQDNYLDPIPNATLTLQSSSTVGYTALTLQNTDVGGSSWTIDVGGNNQAGQGGAAINEGNFTLVDNVASAYRLVVMKDTGNVLINSSVDDVVNQLQVQGSARVTDNFTANTATFLNLAVTGTSYLVGAVTATTTLDVGSTATFNAGISVATTSTFNQTVVIGSSALDTTVTGINTIDPTSIASFDATLYRSARCVAQVTDQTNGFYQLVEIILLHDDYEQVYKSEYGIINTGPVLGEFTTDLNTGTVNLYFTAYQASQKIVNVVRTSISV